ncbi:MAG: hypothetical protein KAS39_02185, partial [Actinomycetia bacterium]|nr:hypothetical protein [Actinomycetes bacterium]
KNLRIVTTLENAKNRTIKNKHGYRGISKIGNKYYARKQIEGKMVSIPGSYETPEEAYSAYLRVQ